MNNLKIRLGFGLLNYPFADGRGFFRWVEMLEAARVDSVWQSDRLISSDNYLESLSALASLAGCTERIKFGMNAIVAPLRDPLVLAKQCATIDFLSGGRLLPMFGVGYPKAAEWSATGRSSDHRGSRANEMFELMTRLWSEESVTYEGQFYQYKNATVAPRPVQQPLPLWIGGSSDAAIKRTARLGSGWIGGIASPAEVERAINGIKDYAVKYGRSIDDDHYGTSLAYRIGSPDDDAVVNSPFVKRTGIGEDIDVNPLFCIGSTADVIARLREYIAVGASSSYSFRSPPAMPIPSIKLNASSPKSNRRSKTDRAVNGRRSRLFRASLAARSIVTRAGLVDPCRAALEHRAVQLRDRRFAFRLVRHFHKAEAFRSAGIAISDDFGIRYLAVLFKRFAQFFHTDVV